MSSEIMTETLEIVGMTCVNCENRIESKLQSVAGISGVKVSYSAGMAIVTFDSMVIGFEQIVGIIEELDYKVKKTVSDTNHETKGSNLLGVVLIVFALVMLSNYFGGFKLFNSFPQAEAGMGYGMLFIIGLLTSIHCVAMCGGINLSQCVPQKVTPEVKIGGFSVLKPGILYNLGRVISYTLVGGIVGAIGRVVSFSGPAKGAVQLVAGLFMVIMGLNMMNIFPELRKLTPRMPKVFAKKLNYNQSSKSPLVVGLLNGLMPCGPLQTMQLYALSTGEPLKVALSMFLFSLGTVPLMFGLAALSAVLSKKFTGRMMTVSAVLIVVLGVSMFSSGMSLSGLVFPSLQFGANGKGSGNKVAIIEAGVQTVTTKLSSGRYQPITVEKGVPVKWIIKAQDRDINGCNNEIIIPKFNRVKELETGDNIIEFTPTESGTFVYSCWMGMIRSEIVVVDDINNN